MGREGDSGETQLSQLPQAGPTWCSEPQQRHRRVTNTGPPLLPGEAFRCFSTFCCQDFFIFVTFIEDLKALLFISRHILVL